MTDRPETTTPRIRSGAILAGLLVALVLLHRSMFRPTLGRSYRDPLEDFFFATDATMPAFHLLLMAVVLVYRRKDLIDALARRNAPVLGSLAALASLAALTWSTRTLQPDLALDAFLASTAAAALLLGGLRMLYLMVLPLGIMALSRPLPPMFSHTVHDQLQQMTASVTHSILGLSLIHI